MLRMNWKRSTIALSLRRRNVFFNRVLLMSSQPFTAQRESRASAFASFHVAAVTAHQTTLAARSELNRHFIAHCRPYFTVITKIDRFIAATLASCDDLVAMVATAEQLAIELEGVRSAFDLGSTTRRDRLVALVVADLKEMQRAGLKYARTLNGDATEEPKPAESPPKPEEPETVEMPPPQTSPRRTSSAPEVIVVRRSRPPPTK